MTHPLITVGDLVVSELNHSSRSWTGQFTAERLYLAKHSRESLANLKVDVLPWGFREEDRKNRAGVFDPEITVFVSFMKLLAAQASVSEFDTLLNLIHDVFAHFRKDANGGNRVLTGGWPVIECSYENGQPWALDDLEEGSAFTGSIELTIKGPLT